MRRTTTGDLVDHLELKARQAEKARLIATLHPTGANAAASKKADREVRNCRDALNRHFTSVVKEAVKLSRPRRKNIENYSTNKKRLVDKRSPKR